MGAALAAILLGPWAGTLIMTCVLIAQCLIFQDGGLLALGANVLNMGLIGSFSGYGVYRLIILFAGKNTRSRLVAGFVGSWAAIVLASIACSLELAFSGTSPIQIVLPAMAGIHALIGIVEGAITVAVLGVITATRSDLLEMVHIKAGGEAK